ncbi:ABC transporter permease [Microlunatus speluncae]|uniref:ABC transporter permease n=1 Tax=Microlunatus speluncae TaxID=2594267 RepID=UPI0012662506|nr:ABC transporter permease [Microlunatus speluncae]
MSVAAPTDSRELTPPTVGVSAGRRSLAGYLVRPILVVVTCAAIAVVLAVTPMDSLEARALALPNLLSAVWEHIQLTFASTVLVVLIAIPLGILFSRRRLRVIRPPLIGLLNLGQAVPTIGVLVLLAVGFAFLGFGAAIIGLVIYAIIPVMLNTIVGLQQVDPAVLESGRGMGLSARQVLFGIELPLSVPIILAGVRTALVINVGTATLASYINAGGLGRILVAGMSTNRLLVQIISAVLTAVLALLIDYLAGVAEDLLRPAGL